MLFVRVNEYTIRCIIEESEIDQMGFQLDELYKNQDKASDFMRNIMEKGREAGFQIAGSFQAVQAAVMPDHKLVLNFVDVNPDEQIDFTIGNFLTAHEAVEIVGKNRLEEILNLKGQEKASEFQKIMIEYQNAINQNAGKRGEDMDENQFEQNVVANSQQEVLNNEDHANEKEQEQKILTNARYVIQFHNLTDLTKFAKELSFETHISLYKEKKVYYLVADLDGLDEKAQNNLVFHAKEYAMDFQKNTAFEAFLTEHAQRLIYSETLNILKNL